MGQEPRTWMEENETKAGSLGVESVHITTKNMKSKPQHKDIAKSHVPGKTGTQVRSD